MLLNSVKTMIYKKRLNKGVTMMEIVIVATLSCIIMGVGMAMMNRSNIQFKKSNDLISIQRLMDNIIERIRSDVRSLKRVKDYDENKKNTIKFVVLRYSDTNSSGNTTNTGTGNDDDNNFALIEYTFNTEEKTLYRFETIGCDEYGDGGQPTDNPSNFHGARQVISMNFEPVYFSEDDNISNSSDSDENFKYLNVAMQISSNEYSGKKTDASTLSIACQFYSTCVESELRIKISNSRRP